MGVGERLHLGEMACGAAGVEVDDETRFQRRKSLLTTDYTDATDWKNKTRLCRARRGETVPF